MLNILHNKGFILNGLTIENIALKHEMLPENCGKNPIILCDLSNAKTFTAAKDQKMEHFNE